MLRLGRLRFLVYLSLAVLVILGGARLVLSSGMVANRVAERLAGLIGVPVGLDEANIALGGRSSFSGLRIFESDNARPETPWAVAQRAETDFSAVDIFAADAMPKEVTLTGAAVELRFDKDGTFLTRLPKPTHPETPMPALRMENVRFTLHQAGREKPLVVTGVTASFTFAGTVFEFTGTCHDPDWGTWTVRGSYDLGADIFRLHLHTDRAEVTAEKLALIPFIGRRVWQQVPFTAGATPVELDVTVPAGKAEPTYKVVLKPEQACFRVACISLDAEQASGDVEVENDVVRLRNIKGRVGGGIVETAGNLDFHVDDPVLRFTYIRADLVELDRLPKSWPLPAKNLHGQIEGEAAPLSFVIQDKGVLYEGTGKGELDTSAGVQIKLKLSAHGNKFEIGPDLPSFLPKLPF